MGLNGVDLGLFVVWSCMSITLEITVRYEDSIIV